MTGKGKKIQNWGWIIKIGAQETLEDREQAQKSSCGAGTHENITKNNWAKNKIMTVKNKKKKKKTCFVQQLNFLELFLHLHISWI